jgi:hypothetical protein
MKPTRANFRALRGLISVLLLTASLAQAGDAVVTGPYPVPPPRKNPLAPLGRVAGGAAQWAGTAVLGTFDELSRTAHGAATGGARLVTNSTTGVVRGAARYANDTKSDNR